MRAVALVWHTAGFAGVAVGCIEITLAGLVFHVRPDRPANRFLGAALFSIGLFSLTSSGIRFFQTNPEYAYASLRAGDVALVVALTAYALFVSTLPSPLVGWLRWKPSRFIVGSMGVVTLASQFMWPRLWLQDTSRSVTTGAWSFSGGPLRDLWLNAFTIPLLVVAVSAALHSWRRATTRSTRLQMRTYAIGFGTQDGVIALYLLLDRLGLLPSGAIRSYMSQWVVPSALFFGSVVLSYAMLRHHLFDFDLKIKWTIRRGTVASAFVAVFVVVGVMVENLLTGAYGWIWGGLAAGLLLFAFAPLQRFAEQLADRAMPGVKDTPMYREFRKWEVYKAAVEGIVEDQDVSAKERRTLERLREKLGIPPAEAFAMEKDVLARLGIAGGQQSPGTR